MNWPWSPTSLLFKTCRRLFPQRQCDQCARLTTLIHPVSRLSAAIPPLPPDAFIHVKEEPYFYSMLTTRGLLTSVIYFTGATTTIRKPLIFWRSARNVLRIPATSASTERYFRVVRRLMQEQWTSLCQHTACKFQLTNNWGFLCFKYPFLHLFVTTCVISHIF
jgi:hypothetical protein